MKKLIYLLTERFALLAAVALLVAACAKDEVETKAESEEESEYVTVFNEVPDEYTEATLEDTLIDLFGESYAFYVQKIKVTGEINQADFDVLATFAYVDLSDVRIVNSVQVGATSTSESGDGLSYTANVTEGHAIPRYAFSIEYTGTPVLKEIILPTDLNAIGKSAFYGNTKLERVVFKDPAEAYVPETEYDDEGNEIESTYDPDAISMTIYPGAFSGCKLLSDSEFDLSPVKSIDQILENAFDSCIGLLSFTIPSGVEKLGNQVFKDCTGLTSVDIPKSITTLGSSIFLNCENLSEVTVNWAENYVPNIDLTTFPTQFRTSTKEAAIAIPDSEEISTYHDVTGWNYYGLVQYSSKDNSLESIYGTEFTVTSSEVNDAVNSGDQDSDLYGLLVDYYGADFMDEDKTFDFLILEGDITANDFQYMQNFKKIDLSSLTDIDFYTNIATGESYDVAFVPDDAFNGNTKLVEYIAPTKYSHKIGKRAFKDCTSLTTYTTASTTTVTLYDEEAFMGCSALSSSFYFSYSNAVTIGDRAFSGCTVLSGLSMQPSSASLGSGENVNQYDGVTSIGEEAFKDCEALTSVTFSKGLRAIGADAFDGCYKLTTIYTGWDSDDVGFSEVPVLALGVFPTDFSKSSNHSGGVAYPAATHKIVVKDGTEKMFNGVSGWRDCYAMTNVSGEDFDASTIYRPAEYSGYSVPDFETSLQLVKDANDTYYTTGGASSQPLVIEGYMTSTDAITMKSYEAGNVWKEIDLSVTNVQTLCEGMFENASTLITVKLPSSIATLPSGMFEDMTNSLTLYLNWLTPTTLSNALSNVDNSTSGTGNVTDYFPSGTTFYVNSAVKSKFEEIIGNGDNGTVNNIGSENGAGYTVVAF